MEQITRSINPQNFGFISWQGTELPRNKFCEPILVYHPAQNLTNQDHRNVFLGHRLSPHFGWDIPSLSFGIKFSQNPKPGWVVAYSLVFGWQLSGRRIPSRVQPSPLVAVVGCGVTCGTSCFLCSWSIFRKYHRNGSLSRGNVRESANCKAWKMICRTSGNRKSRQSVGSS